MLLGIILHWGEVYMMFMSKFKQFFCLLFFSLALCVGFSPIVSYAGDNVLVYDEPYLQYYDDFMQVLHEYAPVLADPDSNGYYTYNSTSHNMVYGMSWGNMYSASDFDSYLPEASL